LSDTQPQNESKKSPNGEEVKILATVDNKCISAIKSLLCFEERKTIALTPEGMRTLLWW
jgi:hypothetical protein